MSKRPSREKRPSLAGETARGLAELKETGKLLDHLLDVQQNLACELRVAEIMGQGDPAAPEPSLNGSNGGGAPPPPVATAAAPEGRNPATGRFVRGNKGGPGNPYARQANQFRKAMFAAVDQRDFCLMVAQVVARATMGDLAAIKLVFAYLLGPPPMPLPEEEQEDGRE
jgi:hypothetical protein